MDCTAAGYVIPFKFSFTCVIPMFLLGKLEDMLTMVMIIFRFVIFICILRYTWGLKSTKAGGGSEDALHFFSKVHICSCRVEHFSTMADLGNNTSLFTSCLLYNMLPFILWSISMDTAQLELQKHTSSFTKTFMFNGSQLAKMKKSFPDISHEIYRDKAVGLKSCKFTLKITIYVNMWNLGQFRQNFIFCQ